MSVSVCVLQVGVLSKMSLRVSGLAYRMDVTVESRKQRERERQAQLVKDRRERSRRPAGQSATEPVTPDDTEQLQQQQHE